MRALRLGRLLSNLMAGAALHAGCSFTECSFSQLHALTQQHSQEPSPIQLPAWIPHPFFKLQLCMLSAASPSSTR